MVARKIKETLWTKKNTLRQVQVNWFPKAMIPSYFNHMRICTNKFQDGYFSKNIYIHEMNKVCPFHAAMAKFNSLIIIH